MGLFEDLDVKPSPARGGNLPGDLVDLGVDPSRKEFGVDLAAHGEAAGDRDQVEVVGQLRLAVPDHLRVAARDQLQRLRHVPVAIGTGEGDDGGAEAHAAALSMR